MRVDLTALKVNQAGIVVTILVAFLAGIAVPPLTLLIPLLAVVLLLGSMQPSLALFKQLYFRVLKPAGLLTPQVVEDDPTPHNFAQALGGVVLALASILLVTIPVAGLALALLVAVLAFVNLAFGYCLGCQIYFQLRRRGVVRT